LSLTLGVKAVDSYMGQSPCEPKGYFLKILRF